MSEVFVIDVGHTRLKQGRFTFRNGEWHCLDFQAHPVLESLASGCFLSQIPAASQVVLCGSMLMELEKLAERIRQERRYPVALISTFRQIPLVLDVEFPERVGPDRLLNGLFASREKSLHSAAIVIASGTALVVDLISPDSRFLGGTISPGLLMGARALAHFTERLPELTIEELPFEPVFPGKQTHQAIAAGLVHSHRGAVQSLVAQCQQALLPETPVEVFLTGGGAPWLQNLGFPCRSCPEMTLRGALLAWEAQTTHEKPTDCVRREQHRIAPSNSVLASRSLARRFKKSGIPVSSQTPSLQFLPLQAACLTPQGRGAVAVIVLAGPPTALDDVLAQFFKTPVPQAVIQDRQRTVFYGAWMGDDQEDIVLTRLSESHVEIQCHGGPAPVERILTDLRQSGAAILSGAEFQRLRQPLWQWEFDQALANAQTWKVAELLLNQREVVWPKTLAAWSVFPKSESAARQSVEQQIAKSLAWAKLGNRLQQPLQIVLTGRPNVGKSSLINAILGYERSIVFDQPGTTRDVVTTSAALGGWPVEFSDTAGLRDGAPALESEGIARAHQRLQTAELRVIVLDQSQPLTDFDRQLMDKWPESLVVVNKIDVPLAWTEPVNRATFPLSCQTGAGVDDFLQALTRAVTPSLPPATVCWPLNERQVNALRRLQNALESNDAPSWETELRGLIAGGD